MAWRAFLLYTGLRVALLAVTWWLVQLTTPLRGLLALAVALLVSGLISVFVLDRQRERLSVGVAGFFSRLNARIDASTRAEDEWDDRQRTASRGEQDPEREAVGEEEGPGRLEDGDEGRADRA